MNIIFYIKHNIYLFNIYGFSNKQRLEPPLKKSEIEAPSPPMTC